MLLLTINKRPSSSILEALRTEVRALAGAEHRGEEEYGQRQRKEVRTRVMVAKTRRLQKLGGGERWEARGRCRVHAAP